MKGECMKRLYFAILICFFICIPVKAQEKETETIEQLVEEKMEGTFDFRDIDEMLHEIMPGKKMEFGETVMQVLTGKTDLSTNLLIRLIEDRLFYEFRAGRKGLIQILLIAIIASLFTNLSGVLRNNQIAEIGFYVLYMLLVSISLHTFQTVMDSASVGIEKLLMFMRALGPVYFLAVALTSGSGTSIIFYQLILFFIYMIELLVLNFLIPLLHIYMVVKILDHISSESYLSKLAELIESGISWISKTLLAAVIGLNLIQGLIAPAVDSLRRGILQKGVEALPVIGDAIGGTAEVVLGTAVLMKNGIGVAGAIICMVICAVPILQIFGITFLYKVAAALIQPVSDSRIVGCVSAVGDGSRLLLKLVCMTGLLFLITIAIVAATTS